MAFEIIFTLGCVLSFTAGSGFAFQFYRNQVRELQQSLGECKSHPMMSASSAPILNEIKVEVSDQDAMIRSITRNIEQVNTQLSAILESPQEIDVLPLSSRLTEVWSRAIFSMGDPDYRWISEPLPFETRQINPTVQLKSEIRPNLNLSQFGVGFGKDPMSDKPFETEPGELVIGTSADWILVRIQKDGTIHYGEEYSPDEAAKLLWEALARHRKATEDEHILMQHIQHLMLQLGKQDLRYEECQRKAKAANATAHDRFQEERAAKQWEMFVHQLTELARSMALGYKESVDSSLN